VMTPMTAKTRIVNPFLGDGCQACSALRRNMS